jgi:hypothetical protein
MRVRRAVQLAAVLLLAGCGAVPTGTGSDPSAATTASPPMTTPTTTSFPSPTTPTGWQTYTDSLFGFSIAYPPNFTFRSTGSSSDPAGYRAVDNKYLGGYPPGQVEVNLYSMDSDSVSNWISKHTGPLSAPASQAYYWPSTSNVQETTGPGRPAIYFEAPAGSITIHATAFLRGSSRVVILDWWSADPTYSPTVELVAQRMLASFRD